jgi:uncharacterized MAPEG superfamily protein
MLLGFAAWTVLLLLFTVGVYRWSLILTGRVPIQDFRADNIEGKDWYKRAMRAHANCIENLPVFTVIVFALFMAGVSGPTIDYLCAVILAARVIQSLIHVCFKQTNIMVSLRFMFFITQIICFLALMYNIVRFA